MQRRKRFAVGLVGVLCISVATAAPITAMVLGLCAIGVLPRN